MASNHSIYKHPNKWAKAKPEDKTRSKYERRIRIQKISYFKLLARITYLTKFKMHNSELLMEIRRRDPKLFEECLEWKDEKFGKLEPWTKFRVNYYGSQYKEEGTSQIRGWIKKQIDGWNNRKKTEVRNG